MAGTVLGKLVLMDDHAFLVADESGEIGVSDVADGLYHNDTRFLSHLTLALNGQPLTFLAAPQSDSAAALVVLTNPALALDDGTAVLPQTIEVRRTRVLHQGMHERLEITSYNRRPIPIRLELTLAADFRDMFDIRGFATATPGRLQPSVVDDGAVCLRYLGRDDRLRETLVRLDPPGRLVQNWQEEVVDPSTVTLPDASQPALVGAHRQQRVRLVLERTLAPHTPLFVSTFIQPREQDEPAMQSGFETSHARAEARRRTWLEHEVTRFSCSDPALCRLLERSVFDLYMLTRWTDTGPVTVAGVPWFACPFGRDSLIAAYEALVLSPTLAAGTLRFLARYQGTRDDPWRDEEPGKIMHELRSGELARLGEVPFTPYYGSVDATPLFLMLLAETDRWLGDDALLEALWPAAERAFDWLERRELLTYETRSTRGIRNQGWKDSDDSTTHVDGSVAEPPIALIEAQAYAYAARRGMAALTRRRGDHTRSDEILRGAERFGALVRSRFWLADLGCYAQALDRDGRPVAVVTSNAAHALFAGLASPSEAAALAERLACPDMLSGWGLRTLSSEAISFNPMSYHNGSIWPHDNAIAAAGLAAYGQDQLALALFDQIVAAAQGFRSLRLPELYCGFPRLDPSVKVPAAYPVSCSPQAWAAGAPLLMLRALLKMEPDARAGRLTLRPRLPARLEWVQIENLRVGDGRASFRLHADGRVDTLPGSHGVEVVGTEGAS